MQYNSIDELYNKFTRQNQVHASYHQYVCYLGIEKSTGNRVFWFECYNDKLSIEQQQISFKNLNEAKSIKHSNLLKILGVYMTLSPPRFFIITESTHSPTLSDYLQTLGSPPSTKTILKWFKSICQVIQVIHHSPLNFVYGNFSLNMVYYRSADGSIKIRMPLTYLSNRIIPKCSLKLSPYQSPERIQGVISKANDIWSVGIALLEIATQTAPYSNLNNPFELLIALSNNQMPDQLNNVSNPEIATLIRLCLAPVKERADIDMILNHPILDDSVIGIEKSVSLMLPVLEPLIIQNQDLILI